MSEYLIVTNNPVVIDEFDHVVFATGNFEDVMIKVRDLVHQGFELISHPIGASIRMIYSPYRSVLLGQKQEDVNFYHIEAVENSILNYRKLMSGRKIDSKNAGDYAQIDIELLKSALNEDMQYK